jgi:pimeloyl-ACP methyl ester carboxylesterase
MAGERRGIVLIHGGQHRPSCWDRLRPFLTSPAVAAELAGRDGWDGTGPSIDDHVRSVGRAIDSSHFERMTLVGHSLAGLVLPELARRYAGRVTGVVFVSCVVPPDGGSLFDEVPSLLRGYVRRMVGRRQPVAISKPVARLVLCHSMDRDQRRFVGSQLVPEPLGVLAYEPVSLQGIAADVRLTFVRLEKDRVFPPRFQDRMVRNLGRDRARPPQVVALGAGHAAMVTRPRELGAIIEAAHR